MSIRPKAIVCVCLWISTLLPMNEIQAQGKTDELKIKAYQDIEFGTAMSKIENDYTLTEDDKLADEFLDTLTDNLAKQSNIESTKIKEFKERVGDLFELSGYWVQDQTNRVYMIFTPDSYGDPQLAIVIVDIAVKFDTETIKNKVNSEFGKPYSSSNFESDYFTKSSYLTGVPIYVGSQLLMPTTKFLYRKGTSRAILEIPHYKKAFLRKMPDAQTKKLNSAVGKKFKLSKYQKLQIKMNIDRLRQQVIKYVKVVNEGDSNDQIRKIFEDIRLYPRIIKMNKIWGYYKSNIEEKIPELRLSRNKTKSVLDF